MSEQRPIDVYTAEEFQRAISQAAWQLNFPSFCQLLGLRENESDQHSLEMWRAFQALGTALSKFDKVNLSKIVRHGLSLALLFCLTITATAQEQPARTYAGGGMVLVASAATDGKTVAGVYVDTAYDLRYGFQARFGGEYRKGAVIPRIFTGDDDILIPASEVRYGGALVYHVGEGGKIRPFVGGGIFAAHQFQKLNPRPLAQGGPEIIYDASVNPLLLLGAGIGKRSEISFTKYFTDTYSYSGLRGYGFDFSRVQRVSGHFHFRVGARFRRWTYREGEDSYSERSNEFGGFAGFQFQ